MQFVWDPQKSLANFRERGFDFRVASLVFHRPHLVAEDRRKDYGERRYAAIGLVEGVHLVVVYTDRVGEDRKVIRRIISARRASRKERGFYDAAISKN